MVDNARKCKISFLRNVTLKKKKENRTVPKIGDTAKYRNFDTPKFIVFSKMMKVPKSDEGSLHTSPVSSVMVH